MYDNNSKLNTPREVEHDDWPGKPDAAEPTERRLPLQRQQNLLKTLHTSIDRLEDRLAPVLVPHAMVDTNATDAITKEAEIGSPLYHQMFSTNCAIDEALHRIEMLMQRIEC